MSGRSPRRECWKTDPGRKAQKSEKTRPSIHEENFLSSLLREDNEGKAEEVEETRKRTREEETQSGKREVEGEGERIAGDCKRVCFHFCSSPIENLCEGSCGADVFWEAADCGSDCEVTDCVPVCVVDLTSSRDLMVDSLSVSVPIFQFSFL